MAAQNNAATVALQLEKVRDKLPLLYEREDVLMSMIQQRGDVEKVSSRAMRIPLQIRAGGSFGQVDMDGGDLGRGSGTFYEVATVSPIYFKFGVEITKLTEYATNSSEKAIENATKKEVKNGMAQFRASLDKLVQTNGNGMLSIVNGAPAGALLTLGPPMYTIPFYEGMEISTFSNVGGGITGVPTVKRGANAGHPNGEATITKLDPENYQITLDGLPANTVDTDFILPAGIPTGASTGLSLFGIKYHQNAAATGLWLTLNRATYPQLRTPTVAAGTAALSPTHERLALNKIRKALGVNATEGKNIIAYMNLEQEHAHENLAISISTIIKTEGMKTQDRLFAGNGTMAGCKIVSSINADPTRIDFLSLDHWGRAVSQDVDYYEVGGQTVFPLYNATSGGLAAGYIFYFVTGFQIFTDNPKYGSFISGLTKPTGYL